MGFFYWGEENNPNRRQRGRYVTINPRSLGTLHRVDRHDADRQAIRRYERNPNAALDGGRPWATRGVFGGLTLQNGHHRRQAAINRGRRLRVWIPEG
jgi:hypothetical protein